MRHTLLYIAIIFSVPLKGQISFQTDTIKINEVTISRKKINSDPAGYKKVTIDSSALKNNSQRSLADILAENSRIFIKSYGMGGTATPSLRGTGASHTQIAWNGLNLNHPMLGQSDLSLINGGMADAITIYFGGASMTLNSGGIGGIINLETKPVWKKETLVSISPGIGSFGRYVGLIKLKSGTMHFQSVTKAFFLSSENNFRYLNAEISSYPVWETRRNNQVRQQGFLQELYYKRATNVASIRIWYQSASRNLPASMLTQPQNSREQQFDESFRAMLNYDLFKNTYDIFLTGALLTNKLNYTNQLASIDSRNLAGTMILKAEMERHIGDYTKIRITLNEELSVIKSNNYAHNTNRNTAFMTASVERNGNGRFGTSILLREIYDKNTFLVPDFSAGLQYRIIDEKEYYLKTNFSRNSKIPTMNDMFWVPGGNPELKNEYAFICEIAYEMSQKISTPLSLRYDLSVFRNTIKDMIQWHPGVYSYWTADNIQNVSSLGAESSVGLDYTLNDLKFRFTTGYSFTKSTAEKSGDNNTVSPGKQLMYIPKNQVNAFLVMNYGNFHSSWAANFTGKRYVTVDNSKYLPGYFLNNISTGMRLQLKDTSFDMNFNIDNLFNIDYRAIAYYPLPGRSYFIKLIVQLVK